MGRVDKKESSHGDSFFTRGRSIKGESGFKKKGKSQSKDGSKYKKRSTKCWACQREGHYKHHYPILKKGFQSKSDGESDVVFDKYEAPATLTISTIKFDREWILDSYCTFHICTIKKWFIDLQESDLGKVLLGDNSECRVKHIVKVRLSLKDGSKSFLIVVRYVP